MSWSTPVAAVVTLAISAVALTVAAIGMHLDPPGRALVGFAAVGMIVVAALAGLLRPRLRIAEGQLWVRQGRGLVPIAATASVLRQRRWGRSSNLLLITGPDDRMRVYGYWDLGADPVQVCEELITSGACRPTPEGRR